MKIHFFASDSGDAQAALALMRGRYDDAGPDTADIIVAPVDLKMRMAIELRRLSGNPVVLVDQLGRMAGLCGDDEIYRALLRARKLAGKAAAEVAAAMTGLLAEETMALAEQAARRVLAASAEGDLLRTQLAILKRLSR